MAWYLGKEKDNFNIPSDISPEVKMAERVTLVFCLECVELFLHGCQTLS